MNEWRGRGGLTRDMKMVDVNGMVKAEFTLAVNGTRYDSQRREQVVKTTWVSCEAWGTVAEQMYQQGVGKGCDVLITGELVQTKRDGDKDSHTRVGVLSFSVVRMSFAAQKQHEDGPPQSNAQGVDTPPPLSEPDPWSGR